VGPELRALVTAPIGQGDLDGATHAAEGDNPVCGDRLRVQARVEGGRLVALRFRATACPASIAVASCAVRVLEGKSLPLRPPFAALRAEVERLGGLSPFERHALALVEDVLARALALPGG
jgi:nitrogen fixation NifU-like protein